MASCSEAPSAAAIDPGLLAGLCPTASFRPGDVIRHKGHHYKDMYLIAAGEVAVEVDAPSGAAALVRGPGSPIGEIGFLRGCRATATVTARTAATALVIDDRTLWKLETENRDLAVRFSRLLAQVSEQRESQNADMGALAGDRDRQPGPEVLLCRSDAMLHEAMRLRYAVYCEELGRQSPYADHDRRIIWDPLDDFGRTFIAVDNGETIGTLRANLGSEGELGLLEDLYGMKQSKSHPDHTAICTKFVVKKAKRRGLTSVSLIAALIHYGMDQNVVECYIDCIPDLRLFYEKFGFTVVGERFFHYENGPSDPMMLDLTRHGKILGQWLGAAIEGSRPR